MDKLLTIVSVRTKSKLSNYEKKVLTEAFKQIDKGKLMMLDKDVLLDKITSIMISILKRLRQLDIKEIQKTMIGSDNEVYNYIDDIKDITIEPRINIKTLFGVSDIEQLKEKETHHYIVLDSKYKNKSYDGLVWEYVANKTLLTGTFTTDQDLKNVKRIKLYKPTVPVVSKYNNVSNRHIGLLIDEFKAQSMMINKDIRAHWVLKITDKVLDEKTEVCDFDDEDFVHEYKFDTIGVVSKLTIVMTNLLDVIAFNADIDNATVSYGAVTTFTTDSAHGFTNSTYVTITGFTSGNPNADKAIIDKINSKRDQLATITGANTFTLNIDTTSITGIVGQRVSVYYENRRIIIPLMITSSE